MRNPAVSRKLWHQATRMTAAIMVRTNRDKAKRRRDELGDALFKRQPPGRSEPAVSPALRDAGWLARGEEWAQKNIDGLDETALGRAFCARKGSLKGRT